MTLREENEVFRKGSLSFSVSYIKARFVTSHRTLISIRKNIRKMLHVERIAVFVRIIRNTQNILRVDKTRYLCIKRGCTQSYSYHKALF